MLILNLKIKMKKQKKPKIYSKKCGNCDGTGYLTLAAIDCPDCKGKGYITIKEKK
jgi:DnaJ-class molecular chaperone